jgi:dihydropteroate synthase
MTVSSTAMRRDALARWLTDWHAGRRPRPLVMGILNVTPDSFSDGGRNESVTTALAHAASMLHAGANIIDVGGESTRPGAAPVDADEQRRRVLPVIEAIRAAHPAAVISIDTQSATVAEKSIEAGADMINDVSALRADAAMAAAVARAGVPVVLMHMRGTPATMQDDPQYEEVVEDVRVFLAGRIEAAESAGIPRERVFVDPGIGFGKTAEHNLALLRGLVGLRDLGAPVLVGVSRKRFIAQVLGLRDGDDRTMGTAAAVAVACLRGADVLRVHDVAAMRAVVDVCAACRD